MASRRSARVFLPLAREAPVALEVFGWNSGKQSIESKSLGRAVDLAVRGARYETSNYIPKAWRGASGRVPFVVPVGASQVTEQNDSLHVGGNAEQRMGSGRAAASTYAMSSAPSLPDSAASARAIGPTVPAAPAGRTAPTQATVSTFSTSSPVSIDRVKNPTGVSSELRLPSLDQLRELNPEMASIIELHDQQKQSGISVREVVMEALETHVGAGTKLNKTALGKLKVNVLRDVLNAIGADARGNKASLVARVLDEVRKDDENAEAEEVASHLGAGTASRKQMIKLQRSKSSAFRKDAVAQTTATLHGQPGEVDNEAINVHYTRVFGSPDDVSQILVNANAIDVVMINVMGKCAFTDYMIVASARSHQSVHMVAGAVLHELKQRCKEVAPGISPSIEGADDPTPDWLVVDAGSIIVHVFHEDSRAVYDLEGLWSATDKSNVIRVAARSDKLTLSSIQA